jgi:hypothetical protein
MPIVDQWDVQEVIKQIVAELKRRKYLVWFDRKCHAPMPARDLSALTFASHGAVFNMKGSVMVRISAEYDPAAGPDLLLCVCMQDAMSEAVEGAELMLYAVSAKYKER